MELPIEIRTMIYKLSFEFTYMSPRDLERIYVHVPIGCITISWNLALSRVCCKICKKFSFYTRRFQSGYATSTTVV